MVRAFVFVFCFLFGTVATSILDTVDRDLQTFPLGTSGVSLEVRTIQAHPFLAEYDFRFVLKRGSEEIDSFVMSDTGGHSRINVSKLDPAITVFEHLGQSRCLNLSTKTFETCPPLAHTQALGYFDFDSTRAWRFIPEIGGNN